LWHRVDASEVWNYHAGAPIELKIVADGRETTHTVGPRLLEGDRPQAIVAPGAWQSAKSLGDWSLVGCTVGPGFEFAAFELAPPDWSPPTAAA
jgi:predicted cupin superfamily sugar epimerase